ncbi:MAG: ATP-binding cassette domain-containing protein [Clostridia bacterium]|nr:ATP-binding cassette domain-containing protein [Clostridia bacterium]
MITVEQLTKEFKVYKKYEGLSGAVKSLFSNKYDVKTAVNGMEFHIDRGELVGYIGLNGAGKSTTIKMMTGLLVPTSGKCTIDGLIPYKDRKKHTMNIGVVFGQRTQLWWDLPVSESFGVLQKIYAVPEKRYRENLEYLKFVLGLDEFYMVPVRNLSLGQKMRADLAASLLHDPKVVFLDEPTIGLDVLVKDRIRKAIKDINREKDTTVVLTTHDLNDIEEICNRIIVIDKGRKIYDGTIKDLKGRFGSYRSVKFDVRGDNKVDLNSMLNIENKDLSVKSEQGEIHVKFHRDKVQVSDIISAVVNNIEVRDISIQEPEMEDIIKEIYSGQLSLA